MNNFAVSVICCIVYAIVCLSCYRCGLQDGKEYMLDMINELDWEDDDDE